jgi:hypothetical protein
MRKPQNLTSDRPDRRILIGGAAMNMTKPRS